MLDHLRREHVERRIRQAADEGEGVALDRIGRPRRFSHRLIQVDAARADSGGA